MSRMTRETAIISGAGAVLTLVTLALSEQQMIGRSWAGGIFSIVIVTEITVLIMFFREFLSN